VTGPLDGTALEVGIVSGAFAITGLLARPMAGHLADTSGRRRVVVAGSLLTAVSGAMLFLPLGIPGLIASRLVLGAGEGAVYTAGAAWVVDLAPDEMRGRLIGWFGLAIWGALSLGPPLGELTLRATDYEVVWAFAAATPLLGAWIASRIPERYEGAGVSRPPSVSHLISREALGPGTSLGLSIIGYAALAGFVVLHLEDLGIGHGAEVFTSFAIAVVIGRVAGAWIPDRIGGARTAIAAAAMEAIGLVVVGASQTLGVALAGAVFAGIGFSLLFPALALMALEPVPESRRGAAMGTFTAFFDVGMGVGAPLAGVAASIAGYDAAFYVAAFAALMGAAMTYRRARAGIAPASEPDEGEP
jgi:MFS family permease